MVAEAPPNESSTPPKKKEPYSPGVLLIFGVALLLLAGWCLLDLSSKQEWREEGRTLTIALNWGGLIVGVVAAVYCFALAVVRSRRSKAGPPDSGAPG